MYLSKRFNLSGEAYTLFMVFISFLLKRGIFFVFADRLVLQYHSNGWMENVSSLGF
jgi:hypothetical protein